MTPTGLRVREGLQVGAAAYLAVAALYCLFDLLAARGALYSVNLLGMALFRGERDAAVRLLPIPLDFTAISGYGALHLVLLLLLGIGAVTVVMRVESHPPRPATARLGTLAGLGGAIFLTGALTAPLRAMLPWWSILLANALAVLLAGRYLLRKHAVFRHLLEPPYRAARHV